MKILNLDLVHSCNMGNHQLHKPSYDFWRFYTGLLDLMFDDVKTVDVGERERVFKGM